jgi:Ras homolog enriched in brain
LSATNPIYICKGLTNPDCAKSRQVQAEDGKALAEEWNCAWTEASARHNENVSKAFELVIGEVEKQNAPPVEEKSKCIIS